MDRKPPSLRMLGIELIKLPLYRRWFSILLPLVFAAAYGPLASGGYWCLAVIAVMAYTFYSYGSTSHDLVHGNLELPRWVNDLLLLLVEIVGLRSGHAYRAAHLQHHANFPDADDVEGAAAYHSLLWALTSGPTHQFRIWWWAMRHARRDRVWIVAEGIGCFALLIASIITWPMTPLPLIYTALVILGSWTFPFFTAYLPHNPSGMSPLEQTRRFRGPAAAVVFQQHLYHLEHHLYPMVPHQNWPNLAKQLDPYLDRAGVKPVRIGISSIKETTTRKNSGNCGLMTSVPISL